MDDTVATREEQLLEYDLQTSPFLRFVNEHRNLFTEEVLDTRLCPHSRAMLARTGTACMAVVSESGLSRAGHHGSGGQRLTMRPYFQNSVALCKWAEKHGIVPLLDATNERELCRHPLESCLAPPTTVRFPGGREYKRCRLCIDAACSGNLQMLKHLARSFAGSSFDFLAATPTGRVHAAIVISHTIQA
jgi:hypothetical protein